MARCPARCLSLSGQRCYRVYIGITPCHGTDRSRYHGTVVQIGRLERQVDHRGTPELAKCQPLPMPQEFGRRTNFNQNPAKTIGRYHKSAMTRFCPERDVATCRHVGRVTPSERSRPSQLAIAPQLHAQSSSATAHRPSTVYGVPQRFDYAYASLAIVELTTVATLY